MTRSALQAEAGAADVVGKEESASARGSVPTREARRIRAVEILIWIRLVGNCVDEIPISIHVSGSQSGGAHQSRESDVEMGEVGAITTPMERIESVQTSQRLCRHRAFHWMKDTGVGRVAARGG